MHLLFYLRFVAWGSASIFYVWAMIMAVFGLGMKVPQGEVHQNFGINIEKESLSQSTLNQIFKPFEPSLEKVSRDLVNDLIFCGRNERPDSDQKRIYFQLKGDLIPQGFTKDMPINLGYQRVKSSQNIEYSFEKSSFGLFQLSLEEIHEKAARFFITKRSEKNDEVEKKEIQIPLIKKAPVAWDFLVEGQRADSSLLAKQKARWTGKDLFLSAYGGKKFASCIGKERLDFEENGFFYDCFVKPGDILIRKGKQWVSAKTIQESQGQPILFIRAVNEVSMTCEIWDVYGLKRIVYTLPRFNDTFREFLELKKEIRFVGMQSLERPIIEFVNSRKRVVMDPFDWFLKIDKQWEKISTVDAFDAYLSRRSVGPLFVFEKVTKDDKKIVLKGRLFNNLRNKEELVILEMKKTEGGVALPLSGSLSVRQQKERKE